MEHPTIAIARPEEAAYWATRLGEFLRTRGGEADALERIDTRLDYRANRVTLYGLPDPANELSVADAISHEILHALLYQLEELGAARRMDLVSTPAGDARRAGGL